jgi:hypothetical protein
MFKSQFFSVKKKRKRKKVTKGAILKGFPTSID